MNILFIILYILLLLFIFVYLPVHIWLRIKNGKAVQPTSASYMLVYKVCLVGLIILAIFSMLVYKMSQSLEVTSALGILGLSCIIAGGIKGLLNSKHINDRNIKL